MDHQLVMYCTVLYDPSTVELSHLNTQHLLDIRSTLHFLQSTTTVSINPQSTILDPTVLHCATPPIHHDHISVRRPLKSDGLRAPTPVRTSETHGRGHTGTLSQYTTV